MNRLPGAVFIVDTIKEHIAVKEAVKLHLPIIALVDTNSDPDIPDHIIPCNDDSARTIQLITSKVADAIIEGNAEREAQNEEELLEQAAEEATKAEVRQKKEAEADEGQSKAKVKEKGKRRTRRKKKASEAEKSESSSEEE